MIFCFIIVISLISPVFYTAKTAMCNFDNPNHIEYSAHWYQETPVPQLLVGTQEHFPLIVHAIYMATVSIASYSISMFLAKKTLAELEAKSSILSFKNKTLQAQLARYVLYFIFLLKKCGIFLGLCLSNHCAHYVTSYNFEQLMINLL